MTEHTINIEKLEQEATERERREHSAARLRNFIFWSVLTVLSAACVAVASMGGW